MPIELNITIDLIKDLYKEIESLPAKEKELVENLACTLEIYEKSVS